jgi:hypothetical protein
MKIIYRTWTHLYLGFQDFLIVNKVVGSKDDIPSRTILSPINLNKIHDVCVQKTKEQLKLSSEYPTIRGVSRAAEPPPPPIFR